MIIRASYVDWPITDLADTGLQTLKGMAAIGRGSIHVTRILTKKGGHYRLNTTVTTEVPKSVKADKPRRHDGI